MYQVIFQKDALEDIEAAYEWYEEQNEGLGNDLMNEVNTCIKKLSSPPDYYTHINFKYRRIRTKRFPYYLLYEIREQIVVVYKVYHAKQNNSLR